MPLPKTLFHLLLALTAFAVPSLGADAVLCRHRDFNQCYYVSLGGICTNLVTQAKSMSSYSLLDGAFCSFYSGFQCDKTTLMWSDNGANPDLKGSGRNDVVSSTLCYDQSLHAQHH